MSKLTLISHDLCPYVQRAAISLLEKRVQFERVWVDLSNKPNWFKHLSPLGKVPLLLVADGAHQNTIFESSVILEYLEETQPSPLHPRSPLLRAQHRSWMEFGSAILNTIARFYNAASPADLEMEVNKLVAMFERIEQQLDATPWFAGDQFSLVDAVFAPIFRYFDTFDEIGNFGVFERKVKLTAWRARLSTHPSVVNAIDDGYPDRLMDFLIRRNSALSNLIGQDHVASCPEPAVHEHGLSLMD